MTAEERLRHEEKLEKQGQGFDNVLDEDGNLEDGKF